MSDPNAQPLGQNQPPQGQQPGGGEQQSGADPGPQGGSPQGWGGTPEKQASGGRGFAIAAFVCAAVAILVLPIVLGPAAIGLGFVAQRKGDKLGVPAMIAGGVGMALGFLVGALFVANQT